MPKRYSRHHTFEWEVTSMSQGGDTGVTCKCHTCHSQVTRMSLKGDNDVSQRRNYS
ncbi:MAG: hypothetical protein IKR98_01315 [Bacteroidaceae bacterium]|nr:hypothetical protein [Bacteroidaceae bacterium]